MPSPSPCFLKASVLVLAIAVGMAQQLCKDDSAAHGGTCLVEPLDPWSVSPYARYINANPSANHKERPMSAKFVNLLSTPVQQFWDNGTPEGETTHGTYTTHIFFFKRKDTGEEIARFTMDANVPMYIIHGNDPEILNSERYKAYVRERDFLLKYQAEKGQPWLSVYPRDPPVLKIWPAQSLGQEHHITSAYGFWNGKDYSTECMLHHLTCSVNVKTVFELLSDNATLKVVATKPKVFVIENLISPEECDHIIELARSRIKSSVIGITSEAYTDDTRTSRTGWINRHESPQMDNMFKRFADVLGMENKQLNSNMNAEPLQVVHYGTNQHYYNHFDFFSTGTNRYRFSTLLMYLNNASSPEAEGGTGFPKAFGGKGLKVRPPKGTGVLFYSMLEDGNCDEYSEHTGLHVLDGEKWVSNLWIWDPKRI